MHRLSPHTHTSSRSISPRLALVCLFAQCRPKWNASTWWKRWQIRLSLPHTQSHRVMGTGPRHWMMCWSPLMLPHSSRPHWPYNTHTGPRQNIYIGTRAKSKKAIFRVMTTTTTTMLMSLKEGRAPARTHIMPSSFFPSSAGVLMTDWSSGRSALHHRNLHCSSYWAIL